ncbi:RipA family octameric membrane protein [Geodermatophilus sp. URMC 63]
MSARRALTNTFFLTLNTAVFTLIGVFLQIQQQAATGLLVFPVIALLGECGAWFYLLRSYRQLNTAKYQVIGQLEERLPASPYWRAEWTALGEGKDRTKYWPLSHIEKWIPVLFAATYLVGFIIVMLV